MKEGIPNDEVVWAIGSVMQLARAAFDPALLSQSFPPPYHFQDLCEPLEVLSFHCRLLKKLPKPTRLKCPALVELTVSPSAGHALSETAACIGLVVKTDPDGWWTFLPGQQEPKKIFVTEFAQRFTGRIIECRLQPQALADPDRPTTIEFGFRWFIPVLLKHKAVWRDVLIASLALQLIALATPLFTQVIIDKVVAHQSSSTLMVIALGLFIFMVFNALLTWVRQYLVLHTGNRVDAQLGSAVFEHLFRLPFRYLNTVPQA